VNEIDVSLHLVIADHDDDVGIAGRPAICPCGPGTFAIAWTSATPPGKVIAALYSANGSRLADNFMVNTPDRPATSVPVMSLVQGGFAVAWTSGQDVCVQGFGSDGTASGEPLRVNSAPAARNDAPAIGFLPGARVVVSWGLAEAFIGIRAVTLQPDLSIDPHSAEFAVNTSLGVHAMPAISALSGDGFVVGWQGGPNDAAMDGRFRVFNADGAEAVAEQLTRRGLDPGPHSLAPLPGGQFVGAHVQAELAGPDRENMLALSLYGSDGQIIGEGPIVLQHSQSINRNPTVRPEPTGDLIVAWSQRMIPATGVFGQQIRAVRVSPDLTLGATTVVNTGPRAGQDVPCVTAVTTDFGSVFAFAWLDIPTADQPGPPALRMRVMSGDLSP
jgi:hypothetical protein